MQGNSFPVVVKKDGEKFLVKLRAGLSGEYSLLSEWFGNKVGRLIGLNTQTPEWIWLNEEVVCKDVYVEVRDLIKKSSGLNIGFCYIENLEPVESADLEKNGKGSSTDAFLFDLLMLNIDRTTANPNLLKANGDILLSDYESSLLFSQIIDNRDYSGNARILECLRSNLFYQRVEPDQIESFLSKINAISFDELLVDIPEEVLDETTKQKVLRGLKKRKSEGWNLEETLRKLDEVLVETDEERAIRTKANRERLERSIGDT